MTDDSPAAPEANDALTPATSAAPDRNLALDLVRITEAAGMAATLRATSTATAATRLTTDSAASESRPTEPVTRHAMTLRVIVTIAAAIER